MRLHPALPLALAAAVLLPGPLASAAPVHTTWLWHMHQPIYWPDRSLTYGAPYEFAYETIVRGHSQSDVASIFNKDDRVRDYQDYPRSAIQSVLDHPDAGAQVSFAGSLIQNLNSLGNAGWNGGRYASNWWQPYRDAMALTTSGGRRRLDPLVVAMHHSINPLVDDMVFRRMLQVQKAVMPGAWGPGPLSKGFFPAEMCFSTRLIPALLDEGVQWSVVPDIHLARACANYPAAANLDNCDPPNRADQVNPAQPFYRTQSISRGVTTRIPVPFGLQPHFAQHVDPATGAVRRMVVVPAANAMSWNEGYGLYGTGEIDAIASYNDPAKPMLVLFAHDGDNDWAGGHSYYHQNVDQFAAAAVAKGYEPTTVAEFLADHPVDSTDVVHVEDGGWVNADGDFGSPQFINWNWPLVNASGQFDIPNGWAEDERNWAVLTAATNRVLTAEQMSGTTPSAARIADPTLPGTTPVERAWHYLLVGHESGYMYYGTALDFEIKPSLAANRAVEEIAGSLTGTDLTPPTVWLPQRLPWNPGGKGGGSLWRYPGGAGADMARDFHVWTFAHDVSGVDTVVLKYRIDADGHNPLASTQNETYAGGPEVGAWLSLPMTRRAFPTGNVLNDPSIVFSVLPTHIAEQFTAQVAGLSDKLVDYHVEARDRAGNVRRSPIQHVYVGTGNATGGGGGTGGSGGPAVRWSPPTPAAGGTVTISYDAVPGALPDATNPVRIHIGHSNWTGVLSPDPVMTWNPDSLRWTYTYSIPANATQVDFVFTNGTGTWDNNGGADWHIPVANPCTSNPPFTMDGTLDAGVSAVASCGGQSLYAKYDGRWLYVAGPPVAATTNLDHFLMVARPGTTGTRTAPWGKAGTSATWDGFVASENDNAFLNWFDASEAQVSTGTHRKASGAVLEACLDLECAFGSAPASVRVAFAGYGNANGGALTLQVPCGNGDGQLDAAEWITVSSPLLDAGEGPRPEPRAGVTLRATNPVRGTLEAVLETAGEREASVEVLDVHGRRVAHLFSGRASGARTLRLDTAAQGIGPGVYFVVARSGDSSATRRVVVLR